MITTSNYNSLISNFQLLPEQIQAQVADYIQFLVFKYYLSPKDKIEPSELQNKNIRHLGLFKGMIRLSDDFNEPMDDFKEY